MVSARDKKSIVRGISFGGCPALPSKASSVIAYSPTPFSRRPKRRLSYLRTTVGIRSEFPTDLERRNNVRRGASSLKVCAEIHRAGRPSALSESHTGLVRIFLCSTGDQIVQHRVRARTSVRDCISAKSLYKTQREPSPGTQNSRCQPWCPILHQE